MAGQAQEPITFEDVAVYLSRAEWEATEEWQRELYRGVMVANYELLTSLGYPGPKPDVLYRLERREEPWVSTPQSPVLWDGPAQPGAGRGTGWPLERPGAGGLCVRHGRMEPPRPGGRCTQWRLRSCRLLNKFRGVGGGGRPETVAAHGGTVPLANWDGSRSWPGKEAEDRAEQEVEPNPIQSTALRLHPVMAEQSKSANSAGCVCGDPEGKLQSGVQKTPCSSEETGLHLGDGKQMIQGLDEVVLKDHCYSARSKSQPWSSALLLHVLREHDYVHNGRDVAAALRDHEYCQAQRSGRGAPAGGVRGGRGARKSRAATRRLLKRKAPFHIQQLIRKAKRILWRYKRFVSKRLRFRPGATNTGCAEPVGTEVVSPAGAERSPAEGLCGALRPPVEQQTVPAEAQSEGSARESALAARHGPAALPEPGLGATARGEQAARPVLRMEHVLRRASPAQSPAAKLLPGALHEAYSTVLRTVDRMLECVCQAFELGGYGHAKDAWPLIIQIDS